MQQWNIANCDISQVGYMVITLAGSDGNSTRNGPDKCDMFCLQYGALQLNNDAQHATVASAAGAGHRELSWNRP